MAIADLKLGSIILPRSESPKAISRLTEFEWFHKIDTDNDTVTPEIDDLLLEAQKTYQSIDDVIKGLGVPPMVGILEIMFKGTMIKKKDYEIDEIEDMVNDLIKRTPSIIDEPTKLLEDQADTKRSLEEYTSLKETLEVAKKLNIDLSGFGLMKYFYTNLFVVDSKESWRLGFGSAYEYAGLRRRPWGRPHFRRGGGDVAVQCSKLNGGQGEGTD